MRSRVIQMVVGATILVVGYASTPQSSILQAQGSAAPGAQQVIASWKATPQEVAKKMIAKYGQPQEVTANRLIWHDNGPWKFTELVNEEIPHDFPVPHKDMLYQAINYRIKPDTADALLEYDGSLVLERTKGEMGARCDKEEANFLALNLANDVATGRKSPADARRFYADTIAAMMKENKIGDYLKGFQFKVPGTNQGDPDKPSGATSSASVKP